MTAASQASLYITNYQCFLHLIPIKSMMPSNHLILHHPFLLLPSIFPSIRVFSESVLCIRWPKYWSFSFSISLSNEYSVSRTDFFSIDWLDLLASPRDSQERSPTPRFKSINPSTLSFLCCPVLTSIHDYWKSRDIWSNRQVRPWSTKWSRAKE